MMISEIAIAFVGGIVVSLLVLTLLTTYWFSHVLLSGRNVPDIKRKTLRSRTSSLLSSDPSELDTHRVSTYLPATTNEEVTLAPSKRGWIELYTEYSDQQASKSWFELLENKIRESGADLLQQSKVNLGLISVATTSPSSETSSTASTGGTSSTISPTASLKPSEISKLGSTTQVSPSSALSPLYTMSLATKRKYNSAGLAKKYAILRANVLFLYDDEPGDEQHDEKATRAGLILLDDCNVEWYPPDLWESEIWLKQFPLRISHPHRAILKKTREFFIYFMYAPEKEAWFYALRRAAMIKSLSRIDEFHGQEDRERIYRHVMNQHRDRLIEMTDSLSTMDFLLNSIVARMLWNAHKSPLVKERFVKKIRRVAARIRRPAFLDEIQVRDLSFGDAMPMISHGHLVCLEPDGTLIGEAEIQYSGDLRITIATQAKLELMKSKSLSCNLVLSVGIRKVSGKIRIRIAAPPSDRIWIGFYSQPQLQLVIEPLVGATTIRMPLILQLIEKLLRDEFNDAYVLPNMDDLPIVVIPDTSRPNVATNTAMEQDMRLAEIKQYDNSKSQKGLEPGENVSKPSLDVLDSRQENKIDLDTEIEHTAENPFSHTPNSHPLRDDSWTEVPNVETPFESPLLVSIEKPLEPKSPGHSTLFSGQVSSPPSLLRRRI
jgi:hypothetical protein